jgi:hypothetical protein
MGTKYQGPTMPLPNGGQRGPMDEIIRGGAGGFGDVNTPFGGPKPAGKGGLFGSGMSGDDWLNVLTRAAALAQGDYGGAAQIGQLVGKPARDKAKREDDFEDWRKQWDYQTEHTKPVNNDTVADYEYIRQNLGEEAAKQFLQNKADPPQYRQGPDGQFYRISPTQAPAATTPPDFTDDDWNSGTPLGGAGSGQPGFPGQPPRRRNGSY